MLFTLFGAFDRSEFLHRNSRIRLSKITGSFGLPGDKKLNLSPTFGFRGGEHCFLRAGRIRTGSVCQDKVESNLDSLEVPEAFRTTRFSAGPGISGEVNLACRFLLSTGFFIPAQFFVSRPILFRPVSRAGEQISWLAERVNWKIEIFCFPTHRRFGRAPAACWLRGGEVSGMSGEVNGFFEIFLNSQRGVAQVR